MQLPRLYLSIPIRLGCTWGRASALCIGAVQISLSTSDQGHIKRLPETGECPPVLRGFQVFAHCLGWHRDVTSLLSPAYRGLAPALESSPLSSHTAVFSQPKDTTVLHQLPQGAWVYLIHEAKPISEIKTQAKAFHQIFPKVGFPPLLPTPRSSPDRLSSSRLSSGRFIQLCQESPTPSSMPLSWQDHQKR